MTFDRLRRTKVDPPRQRGPGPHALNCGAPCRSGDPSNHAFGATSRTMSSRRPDRSRGHRQIRLGIYRLPAQCQRTSRQALVSPGRGSTSKARLTCGNAYHWSSPGRAGTPGSVLLISGFGVRVPDGAPAVPLLTCGFAAGVDMSSRYSRHTQDRDNKLITDRRPGISGCACSSIRCRALPGASWSAGR